VVVWAEVAQAPESMVSGACVADGLRVKGGARRHRPLPFCLLERWLVLVLVVGFDVEEAQVLILGLTCTRVGECAADVGVGKLRR
jgi:hypothetical protein